MSTQGIAPQAHQRGGRACALLGLLCLAPAASAETVVAIVSEASAPEYAAAAQVLTKGGAPDRLVFRSTAQVARMSGAELEALVQAADVLVLASVFGEDAVRLREALPKSSARTLLPLFGDAAFMRFCRAEGAPAFAGLSPDVATAKFRALAKAAVKASGFNSPEQLLARARAYRDARGPENLALMFRFLTATPAARAGLPPPRPSAPVRWMSAEGRELKAPGAPGPAVAILDYSFGDQAGSRELHAALCRALKARGLGCFSALARWGQPTIDALKTLQEAQLDLRGLVVLQDFVLGGGAGSREATKWLTALDVPVLKAVRIADRSVGAWRVSEDGLPDDSVNYRIAMPEVQAIAEPFVVAAAGPVRVEPSCGLEVSPPVPIAAEVEALAARLGRLSALATAKNFDKRLAVVYYNHPPGRHNIGADNLDVPASLLSILRVLKAAGYDTGELPKSSEALLSMLQERGVNLPEDGQALAEMAGKVETISTEDYDRYFSQLPKSAQAELRDGPLYALSLVVAGGIADGEADAARARADRVLGDIKYLVEGAVHPAREATLKQLDQLKREYEAWLSGEAAAEKRVEATTAAIARSGIEGLGGWGPPPGKIMTHDGRLVLPGLRFGKIFLGPQPPRGWELNEELLHANLSFPPPHQYLAFYEYLREVEKVDAVVHVGRHSTYEFLPGRRVGLGQADFPLIALGDLPSVYLYIVDGVGEGIQAKRRGQAIIIDHLTPSLSTTPLYDDLLALRQLVESYEAASDVKGHAGARALKEIRATVDRLHLKEELEASMRPELQARGIRFEEVEGELLVHEIGHYLTHLQERFMPHGLHVFAQAWSPEAVDRMLSSMSGGAGAKKEDRAQWKKALVDSPKREAAALLAALKGHFVPPGPGNDPVRTPEVLPTGRSFHALDASVLPTRLGFKLGSELAAKAKKEAPGSAEGAEAVVLWASDTVRDEGAMVGFGMHMLGVVPVYNSRGIVRGVKRSPLPAGQVRRDVSFVASGLFRDLYPSLCELLDRSVLVALDGAAKTIEREHPALRDALDQTLSRLGAERAPGSESLKLNQLAAHWVEGAQLLLDAGSSPEEAGRAAAARVFGDAPGTYGAGINRLAERSGAWETRAELVATYAKRIGHAYGGGRAGAPVHAALQRMLKRTEHTYLGRASNLYGVLDNNDVFDYLGGLGMAIEQVRGKPPEAFVVQHAGADRTGIDPLPKALLQELRGRHLNPTYLKGLMAHGYAGARTMGSAFLENLWGWQVTSPHIVKSWVWDDVKSVYLDDRYGIGLDDFLKKGDNIHVRTNMQAILLVAAHKGFWDADEETLKALSEDFAQAVVEHGLPGSGHTRPDHPMMADVLRRVSAPLAAQLKARLDAAAGQNTEALVSELTAAEAEEQQKAEDKTQEQTAEPEQEAPSPTPLWPFAVILALGIVGLGFFVERRRRR